MKVKTLMNKTVYSLGPDQNLRDAAQLMWEHDCGWAPVLDQNGIVEATITDRDIAMAAFLNDSRLADIPREDHAKRTTSSPASAEQAAKTRRRDRAQ